MTENNVPAVAGQTALAELPADIAALAAEDAGAGLSQAADDNIVPLIYILQKGSPQVQQDQPETYIEGARAGDIWLRASVPPLTRGAEGILFQPCYFHSDYVEWIPRNSGGGFVARHAEKPEDTSEVEDPNNPKRKRLIRPNGNEVVETRYHIGFVHGRGAVLPYVIPLVSTGHTFSRQFMYMMNARLVPGTDKRAPSYAGVYLLKTRRRENAAGDWYAFEVADSGWVSSAADYNRGKALFESFAAGDKQIEAPADETSDGEADAPAAPMDDNIPF